MTVRTLPPAYSSLPHRGSAVTIEHTETDHTSLWRREAMGDSVDTEDYCF